MGRADELRAELALLEVEERMVAAKSDPSISDEDTAALKHEVRALRSLSRAPRDYARVNATIATADDEAALAAANAELALLDDVTAAAAKHLGVGAAELKAARTGTPPTVAPGDAVASASTATGKSRR